MLKNLVRKYYSKKIIRHKSLIQSMQCLQNCRNQLFSKPNTFIQGSIFMFSTYDKNNRNKRPSPNKIENNKSKNRKSQKQVPKKVEQNLRMSQKVQLSVKDKVQLSAKDEKVNKFNFQVNEFIQTSKKALSSPVYQIQGIKAITPVTWNFLSNLYRIIHIKAQQYRGQPKVLLSWQNRAKIQGLIKQKVKEIQHSKCSRYFEKWTLQNHLQICESLYLNILISQKKLFPNIRIQFLQYISLLPSFLYQNQTSNHCFQFQFKNSLQKQKTQTQSKNTVILAIQIDKLLFNPFSTDNLAFQIIKNIVLSKQRTSEQVINSLKALSTLLTVKQLKLVDSVISQALMVNTQSYWSRMQTNMENKYKNEDTQSFRGKVLTVPQVVRISSILSQLNLKGSSINIAQRIIQSFLCKQIETHQEFLNKINQNGSLLWAQEHKANKQGPYLRFDLILRFYVAIAEIGAVSNAFEVQFQKLFIYKFQVKRALDGRQFQTQDRNLLKFYRQRYSMSDSQIKILLSTLHKFKKGSQVIKTNSESNQNRFIWLQICNYFGNNLAKSFPEEFIFPIMSGIYRGFTSIALKSINVKNNLYQQVSLTLPTLLKRLYTIDPQVSYIEELSLEKLIQFVIVIHSFINVCTIRCLENKCYQAYKMGIVCFYSEFLDKIILGLQNNKVHNQNQEANVLDPNKKLVKQKQQIYSILHICLLYTKIHVQLVNFGIVNKKCQSQKNNNLNTKINDTKSKILNEMKLKLRSIKMSEQMSVLFSLLIKNSRKIIKDISNASQQNQLKTSQISVHLQDIYNELDSFLGFSPQIEQQQYSSQLQKRLIKSLFNYEQSQDEDPDQMKGIKSILNNQKFKSYQLNHVIIIEQIIRAKLIQSQQDFRQYENFQTHGALQQ